MEQSVADAQQVSPSAQKLRDEILEEVDAAKRSVK